MSHTDMKVKTKNKIKMRVLQFPPVVVIQFDEAGPQTHDAWQMWENSELRKFFEYGRL